MSDEFLISKDPDELIENFITSDCGHYRGTIFISACVHHSTKVVKELLANFKDGDFKRSAVAQGLIVCAR